MLDLLIESSMFLIFYIFYLLVFLVYILGNSQYFCLLVRCSVLFNVLFNLAMEVFYFNNCIFQFQKYCLVLLKIYLVVFKINFWSLFIFNTSFISFNILFIVILYSVCDSFIICNLGVWNLVLLTLALCGLFRSMYSNFFTMNSWMGWI